MDRIATSSSNLPPPYRGQYSRVRAVVHLFTVILKSMGIDIVLSPLARLPEFSRTVPGAHGPSEPACFNVAAGERTPELIARALLKR